ncbi:MAG: gliding motility-associated lipoprotein GldD [Flavobacteriaceae bacterium]|jgi:gliding motility-associated lipoprotein GldD
MMRILFISLITIALSSCQETNYIPKPPTYLRLELPDHTYKVHQDDCSYAFEVADLFTVNEAPADGNSVCHKRIDLGPLNGTAYIRYWDIEEPLAYYINSANDEIDRHKIKATKINDKTILRPEDNVFGSFFELQGNVATPFQFYLTDSTDHFIYCEVLFNSTPNYDSLIPTLDYLERDLTHMVETLVWK